MSKSNGKKADRKESLTDDDLVQDMNFIFGKVLDEDESVNNSSENNKPNPSGNDKKLTKNPKKNTHGPQQLINPLNKLTEMDTRNEVNIKEYPIREDISVSSTERKPELNPYIPNLNLNPIMLQNRPNSSRIPQVNNIFQPPIINNPVMNVGGNYYLPNLSPRNQFQANNQINLFSRTFPCSFPTYQNLTFTHTPTGQSQPHFIKETVPMQENFNFRAPEINKKERQMIPSNLAPNPQSTNIYFEYEIVAKSQGKFTPQMINHFSKDLYQILKKQNLSKLSQILITNSGQNEIHMIFSILKNDISNLFIEPYANYFCMKLFIYLDSEDKNIYINNLLPSLTLLSTNKISTYPIQYIIENLKEPSAQKLVTENIDANFLQIALDIYGCHIIEKVLLFFPYDSYKNLSKSILDNFLLFSNNSNGLCIIKKYIEKEYKKDNFIPLKKIIEDNAVVLVQNPYGNYAIQIALDNWELEDSMNIMNQFIGKTVMLSIQKFSSNVIEKCFGKHPKFMSHFLNEISINNYSGLKLLIQNLYGNYVLTKALAEAKTEERVNLINSIRKLLTQISDKKILKKWNNILSNYIY